MALLGSISRLPVHCTTASHLPSHEPSHGHLNGCIPPVHLPVWQLRRATAGRGHDRQQVGAALDTNNDGIVSQAEMAAADTNRDGKISADEVGAAVAKKKKLSKKKKKSGCC